MTRAKVVLKLGLGLFCALGGVAYVGFSRRLGSERLLGRDCGRSRFLLLIVVAWTGSYLFRVVTGQYDITWNSVAAIERFMTSNSACKQLQKLDSMR